MLRLVRWLTIGAGAFAFLHGETGAAMVAVPLYLLTLVIKRVLFPATFAR